MLDFHIVTDRAFGVVRDATAPIVSSLLGHPLVRNWPVIIALVLFVLIFTALFLTDWLTP
jgi:hypothetical protein